MDETQTDQIAEALEQACPTCDGQGWRYDEQGQWAACETCHLRGVIPTAFGKSILAFVRRYLDGGGSG